MDDPLPYIFILFFAVIAALIELSAKAVLSQNHLNIKKIFPDEDQKTERLLSALDNSTKLEQISDLASGSCLIFASCFSASYFVDLLTVSESFDSLYKPFAYLISVCIVFILTFFVLYTFAKCLPAKIGVKHSDSLCVALLPCLKFFTALFTPMYYATDFVAGIFARLAGAKPEDVTEDVTEGEIRQMIDEGRESGSIEESETDMIHGIFEFDDRLVGEIITHRKDVTALEIDSPLAQVVEIISNNGFSRIPVYKESLDDVAGILYVKDLMPLIGMENEGFKLSDYIREALFVPETNSLKELFEKFKSERIQMAVVVDEYGGTLGIVTMEDLIESIMGSISDEYDDEDEECSEEQILQVSDNEFVVDGLCFIKDAEDKLGVSIKNEEECDTVGGLVVSLIGVIPQENEHPDVLLDNLKFTVLSVVDHRVEKLRLEILDKSEDESQTEVKEEHLSDE